MTKSADTQRSLVERYRLVAVLLLVLAVCGVSVIAPGAVWAPEVADNETPDPADRETGKGMLRQILRRNARGRHNARGRANRHPIGMVVTCIDYRIRLDQLLGDESDRFDVARLPGCALTKEMVESIRLAVEAHHVQLLIILEHTDCAMDRLAKSGDRAHVKSLQWHRRRFDAGFHMLEKDELLRAKVANRQLIIVRATYDVKEHTMDVRETIGDVAGLEDALKLGARRQFASR